MQLLISVSCALLGLLILSKLDKKYDLKIKLYGIIGSIKVYKIFIFIITIIPGFAYIFITKKNPFLNPIILSLLFLYHYFSSITEAKLIE